MKLNVSRWIFCLHRFCCWAKRTGASRINCLRYRECSFHRTLAALFLVMIGAPIELVNAATRSVRGRCRASGVYCQNH